jgi:hypothetical protein
MNVRIYRRMRGLGLMALWAFAPAVTVQTDPMTDALHFSVGAGIGEYARVVRSCSGDVLESSTVPFTALGMRAEYRTGQGRVTVFGGRVAPDEDALAGDPMAAGGSGYFGGQIGYEGGSIGVGLGAATYARLEEDVLPSFHLRVGSRDGPSGVFDIAPPTTMPGVTGLVRGGVAFRRPGSLGGFAGIQTERPFEDNEGVGPFVELNVPLSDRIGLDLGGSVHFGSEGAPSDWGLGLGLTFNPWRR